jgi:hypothetical protein
MAADEQEEYHQVNEYYEKDNGLEGLHHNLIEHGPFGCKNDMLIKVENL